MAGIIIDGEVRIKLVAPINIISNQPAFVSDAMNLRQQVFQQKSQRWEITTNLFPSNDSADFLVHSVLNGYGRIFEIQMPQVYRGAKKQIEPRCTVLRQTNVGQSEVEVNVLGQLKSGEFIRFSNHPKVYMVVRDITGSGNLNITPALVNPLNLATDILSGDSVKMRVRFDPSVAIGITYVDGILSDPGAIKLVEAL